MIKRESPPSIESILLQVQMRWAGHVTRMEDVRMPKADFFSKLQEGKRDRRAPRKRYKDQLKRELAQAGINRQSWQQETSHRDSWRSSVRKHRGRAAQSREGKAQEAERASSIQIILSPNLHLSKVQSGLRIKNEDSTSTEQKVIINLPKILVCEESAIIIVSITCISGYDTKKEQHQWIHRVDLVSNPSKHENGNIWT